MTAISIERHTFVPFKGEESICWACGYVIWQVGSQREARRALLKLRGGSCPGSWHGKRKPLMETDVREELIIWVLEDLILAADDDITDGDLLAMINKEKGWSHATLEEAHTAAFPAGYGEWSREKETA